MNFLGDVNDSFRKHLQEVSKDSNSPIRQKAMCDDRVRIQVQSKAINEAFDKVTLINTIFHTLGRTVMIQQIITVAGTLTGFM